MQAQRAKERSEQIKWAKRTVVQDTRTSALHPEGKRSAPEGTPAHKRGTPLKGSEATCKGTPLGRDRLMKRTKAPPALSIFAL